MRKHASFITVAALAGLCGNARADDSLHAIVTITTGVTDNVMGVPEDHPDLDVEADGFMLLSPGIIYTQETRRFAQVASYEFGASMYVRHAEANSYSNRASWVGVWALSTESEIGLEATGVHGEIHSFRASTPAERTEIGLEPASGRQFINLGGQQFYNLRFGRDWGFSQRASFRAFQSLEDPLLERANFATGSSVSLRRSWRDTAIEGSARATLIVNRGPVLTTAGMSSQSQFLVGPSVRLIRDLTESWSFDIGAGLEAVTPADTFEPWMTLPTGLVALRYLTEVGNGEIAYRRTVNPNLFVGETTSNDTVSVRGGIPLPWHDDMGVSGAVGYTRGQILDAADESLRGSIEILLVDTAFHWELQRELVLSARLQRIDQVRDEMASPFIDDVSRTQFIVAVSGRYPSRQAANIPSREAVRADGNDRFRVGDDRLGGPDARGDR